MLPMPTDVDFEIQQPTEEQYGKTTGWVEDAELLETGQFGDDDEDAE